MGLGWALQKTKIMQFYCLKMTTWDRVSQLLLWIADVAREGTAGWQENLQGNWPCLRYSVIANRNNNLALIAFNSFFWLSSSGADTRYHCTALLGLFQSQPSLLLTSHNTYIAIYIFVKFYWASYTNVKVIVCKGV